eukprot:GCRY01002498.1.p1 GENE.GCRY01002498.1~~GCRY01002498.1.p1  ORF type:complete len:218 (-),score=11.88 GCRY01002498.1:73-726(-)
MDETHLLNSARDDLVQFMDLSEKLENEAHSISQELEELGVGIDGSLTDKDGFPLPNIDLYHVRTLRNRLACIRTDHNGVMEKLETSLAEVHRLQKLVDEKEQIRKEKQEPLVQGEEIETPLFGPFVVVKEVKDYSPAFKAGLCNEDRIFRFGTVARVNEQTSSEELLQRIPAIVNAQRGQEIEVVVSRANKPTCIRLTLVPTAWAGLGLLGCRLLPH